MVTKICCFLFSFPIMSKDWKIWYLREKERFVTIGIAKLKLLSTYFAIITIFLCNTWYYYSPYSNQNNQKFSTPMRPNPYLTKHSEGYLQNEQCGNGKHGGDWAKGRTGTCNSCTSGSSVFVSQSIELTISWGAVPPKQLSWIRDKWWFDLDEWLKNLHMGLHNLDIIGWTWPWTWSYKEKQRPF